MYAPLACVSLICGILWTSGVSAMSSESVELQTRLLTTIYETVKDRQLKEGELNLVRNESAGFATSIRSFSEKGAPSVRDGNRFATFDLSMLSEPKSSQVMMQLALKVPRLEYFRCIRYIHLSSDCMSTPGELKEIATHTLLDTERESEWLQVTIDCNNCNWETQQEVHLVLQLRADNNTVIPFTDATAADLKSFLILFTQKSIFPLENIRDAVRRRKRQTEEVPDNQRPTQEASIAEQNRTTLSELLENNVTCSRQKVFITTEEIRYNGDVLAPIPGVIKLTYCFGECSLNPVHPLDNQTLTDARTQMLIYHMHGRQHESSYPLPCCIPKAFVASELIVRREEVIELHTWPNAVGCKCQL